VSINSTYLYGSARSEARIHLISASGTIYSYPQMSPPRRASCINTRHRRPYVSHCSRSGAILVAQQEMTPPIHLVNMRLWRSEVTVVRDGRHCWCRLRPISGCGASWAIMGIRRRPLGPYTCMRTPSAEDVTTHRTNSTMYRRIKTSEDVPRS
jgi:hypothetical protein